MLKKQRMYNLTGKEVTIVHPETHKVIAKYKPDIGRFAALPFSMNKSDKLDQVVPFDNVKFEFRLLLKDSLGNQTFGDDVKEKIKDLPRNAHVLARSHQVTELLALRPDFTIFVPASYQLLETDHTITVQKLQKMEF